jgi:uncharacterized membrane protein YbhN (UPF0104 family)
VPDIDQLRHRATRLEAWIRSRVPTSTAARRVVIGGVLAVLAGAAYLAVESLPDGTSIRVVPLVALAVVTPIMLVLNAFEYAAAAALAGRREGLLPALRVSIYSSTANLLPVPGSVVVRVQALRNRGHRGTVALGATASVGVCWMAVSFAAAGALLVVNRPVLGGLLLAGAAVGFVICIAWGRRLPATRPGPLWVEVAVIAIAKVGAQALRLHLALLALGTSPSVSQSFGIAVSVSVGSAAAFLPAGLGVREGVGSALSAMVGLSAGVGLLAVLIDRAAGLIVAVPLAAVVLLAPERRAAWAARSDADLDVFDDRDDTDEPVAGTGLGGSRPGEPGGPAPSAPADAAR